METKDDAAVYRIAPDQAIVLTTDYFTPIHDDPFTFGQIAAANSLSDVYAMGGRPLVVLNVVGFPEEKLPLEILREILEGGSDRALAAGVPVGGGHSINSPEPFYGMAVVGMVNPDRLLTNAGAKPGDRLVLTKPLGTGIVTSAMMFDKADEAHGEATTEAMVQLNKVASEVMVEHGATCATDVTGFGLIGHAHEMAEGSGLELEFSLDAIPVLPGAMEYAGQWIVTAVGERNREYYGQWTDFGDAPEDLIAVICDPQTSGGLLIAFPPEEVAGAIEKMRGLGVGAVDVGRALEGEQGRTRFSG